MELWDRNNYIDLNGKRQNLETKQIKSHVFFAKSYNNIKTIKMINHYAMFMVAQHQPHYFMKIGNEV